MSTVKCGICAGCIGMGPCDDELGRRGDECGNCALEADHSGPCAWICSTCMGSGWCPECGGASRHDDVTYCDSCSGYGMCPSGCYEGLVSDE